MTDIATLHAAALSALAGELTGAVALRHELHAHPELSGSEVWTAARVAAALGDPGAPVVAGVGRTVRVGPPRGPAVALRAELDALPLAEKTGVAFASAGQAMHACGHDVHLAALVAATRALQRAGAPQAILAVLQPREETYPSGAHDIVESGVLAEHGVHAVIGAHVQPRVPAGSVAVDPGVVNAGSDEFTITITGPGGHGGYPHLAPDPVPALCGCVAALTGALRASVDPTHAATVSVGSLRAGDAANIIPDTAAASGTLRTFERSDRDSAVVAMRRLVTASAEAHGCAGSVRFEPVEPALDNDAGLARAAAGWLQRSGLTRAQEFRSCGSDDFSHYGAAAPSLMMFVGVGEGTQPTMLHEPRFLPPDDRIADVARALLAGYFAAL